MFIKSFVTIFLILFSLLVFTSKIGMSKEATWQHKVLGILLAWSIQSMILANVVVLIYFIWS